MEPSLSWLLEYEVSNSKRYRRAVSMVLVASTAEGNGEFKTMLKATLRGNEPVILLDEYLAIVMSETDKVSGLRAIERWRRGMHHSHVVFSLSTFPADAQSGESLRDCAEQRLQRARRVGAGMVVSD